MVVLSNSDMKTFKKLGLAIACSFALIGAYARADTAVVVYTQSGCDYFIASGQRGFYVLEWYGGHDPDQGDVVAGNIGSYGMKDVAYPQQGVEGRVWVEDYGLTQDSAMDTWNDQCH